MTHMMLGLSAKKIKVLQLGEPKHRFGLVAVRLVHFKWNTILSHQSNYQKYNTGLEFIAMATHCGYRK